MICLKVQEYLMSGKSLDDLKSEHGIDYRQKDNRVILSYSQIDAKDADPIAKECRGLILDVRDWSRVSVPMFRFFNLGQGEAAKLDDMTTKYYEKLDGTLINAYYYDGAWRISTRKMIDADGQIDDTNVTFYDLFLRGIKELFGKDSIDDLMSGVDRCYTCSFELCSPINQIVCHYDGIQIHLLAVRNHQTLEELSADECALTIGVPRPMLYAFKTVEEALESVRSWNPLEHEGVVAVDANFNRIKIKNPAYCDYSHMRDSLGCSYRACVSTILLNKDDDVIAFMPKMIQERLLHLKPIIAKILHQTEAEYNDIKHIEVQKDFALAAKEKLWPAALFAMRRGTVKSAWEFAVGGSKFKVEIPNTSLDSMLELCRKVSGEALPV